MSKTTTGAGRFLFHAVKTQTGDALAKLVLISLADRANDAGECWPSLATIAKDCETTERSVIRKLSKLESGGFITRIHRSEDGMKTSNLYRLPVVTEGYNVVTQCQEGSDTVSPGVVTECHIKLPVETPIETKGRFTPPSVSEVSDYCRERKNGVDAQKFIDHYEANGWMRGKTKIKCWKACIRTWESRDGMPKSQWKGGI